MLNSAQLQQANLIENHALQSTPSNMSPSTNPNYWMSMLSRQELYNEISK